MGQQGGCEWTVASVEVLEQAVHGLTRHITQQHSLGSWHVLLLHPKPAVMHLDNEWMEKESIGTPYKKFPLTYFESHFTIRHA